jgi:AsmA protein
MARSVRRLTRWLLAGFAALVLLLLLAVTGLWLFFDVDRLRGRIEANVSQTIGRPLHFTGPLRWQRGLRLAISSEGGEVANAPGFDAEPFAHWQRISLGVALWPLLHKQVLIDRVVIDGLALHLQRDAAGRDNWQFAPRTPASADAAASTTLRVGAVVLRDARVRIQDATTGADWRAESMAVSARLPADLAAADRRFADVRFAARLSGGQLPTAGVQAAFEAAALHVSSDVIELPAFAAQWADASLTGSITAKPGEPWSAQGSLALRAPSLRTLVATVGSLLPSTADPKAFGPISLSSRLAYGSAGLDLSALDLQLDDTRMTGNAALPTLQPPALRFDLAADRMVIDRYLEPDDAVREPFTLPLAGLKALDARGVLRIERATLAGATARKVRIDVE